MSKMILLFSIFVLAVIYPGVYAACPGGWCHPQQGYGCCAGNICSNNLFQGTCVTPQEYADMKIHIGK